MLLHYPSFFALLGILLVLLGFRRRRRHYKGELSNIYYLAFAQVETHHARFFPGLLQQFSSDLVVSDQPGQFGHLEFKLLFLFIPLQVNVPFAVVGAVLELETEGNLQLFMGGIEEPLPLHLALGFIVVHALTGFYFGVRNEVVPEGMGEFCKVLPIKTHIQHIKRVFMTEVLNIGDLAASCIAVVCSLCTHPVLAVFSSNLSLLLRFYVVVFETHSYVVTELEHLLRDRQVQLYYTAPQD